MEKYFNILERCVLKQKKNAVSTNTILSLKKIIQKHSIRFFRDDVKKIQFFSNVTASHQFSLTNVPECERITKKVVCNTERRRFLRKKLSKNIRLHTNLSSWILYEVDDNFLAVHRRFLSGGSVSVLPLNTTNKIHGCEWYCDRISQLCKSVDEKKRRNTKNICYVTEKPIKIEDGSRLKKAFELERVPTDAFEVPLHAKTTLSYNCRRRYNHIPNDRVDEIHIICERDISYIFGEFRLHEISKCEDRYVVSIGHLDIKIKCKFLHKLHLMKDVTFLCDELGCETICVQTLQYLTDDESQTKHHIEHSWLNCENLRQCKSWTSRANHFLKLAEKNEDTLTIFLQNCGFFIICNIRRICLEIRRCDRSPLQQKIIDETNHLQSCLIPYSVVDKKISDIVHDLYYHYRGYSCLTDKEREYCRLGLEYFDLHYGIFPRKLFNTYKPSGKFRGKNKWIGFGTECRNFKEEEIKQKYEPDGEASFAIKVHGTYHSTSSRRIQHTTSNLNNPLNIWLLSKKKAKHSRSRKNDNKPLF